MTNAEADMMRLEEQLREAKFAFVEYRDSIIGRQPYLKKSGLAIWEVIMIASAFNFNAEQIAQFYPYPVEAIEGALQYYETYQDEINQAVEDNNIGYDAMKQLLPNVHLVIVSEEGIIEVFDK